MNVLSLLAANAGAVFSIVFTILVLVAFIAIVIILWWKEIKQSKIKNLFSGIKNFFLRLFNIGGSRVVKTVYQNKEANYSGTEFLPVPTKAATTEFSYEFMGWDKNHVDEKGNTVVKAVYLQKVNEYQINFYDDDKTTLLRSGVVQCGATMDVSDLSPTKPESKEFSYEFVGWDKDISAFYRSENVYAVYKALPKKYTYTFYDADGKSIIYQSTAIYGTPISLPKNPHKAPNNSENFEFFGWKNYKEGMTLTKDVSFEAIYKVKNTDSDNSTVDAMVQDSAMEDNSQNIADESQAVEPSQEQAIKQDENLDSLSQGDERQTDDDAPSAQSLISTEDQATDNYEPATNNFSEENLQTEMETQSEKFDDSISIKPQEVLLQNNVIPNSQVATVSVENNNQAQNEKPSLASSNQPNNAGKTDNSKAAKGAKGKAIVQESSEKSGKQINFVGGKTPGRQNAAKSSASAKAQPAGGQAIGGQPNLAGEGGLISGVISDIQPTLAVKNSTKSKTETINVSSAEPKQQSSAVKVVKPKVNVEDENVNVDKLISSNILINRRKIK